MGLVCIFAIPELVLSISSLVHPAHFSAAALLSECTGPDGIISGS